MEEMFQKIANKMPVLDYRISVVLAAICVDLFVWAFLCNDLFGVMIATISGITNLACATFLYSIQDLIRKEQPRQYRIVEDDGISVIEKY